MVPDSTSPEIDTSLFGGDVEAAFFALSCPCRISANVKEIQYNIAVDTPTVPFRIQDEDWWSAVDRLNLAEVSDSPV